MSTAISDVVLDEVDAAVSAGMMEFISPIVVKALIREVRRLRQRIEDMDDEHARTRNALAGMTADYEHVDAALRDAQLEIAAFQRDRARATQKHD